jgi:hypothetical protein
MKFLLSIHRALVDLLGKPIADSNAPVYPNCDVRPPLGRPRRQSLGVHQIGRICDVSAPGPRDASGKHHGCRREMGRRDEGASLCNG